jgi:hypothetical protein
MSPSFSFRCPACEARIRAPFQCLGQTRACPACGRRLLVQLSAPNDVGPVLMPDKEPGPDRSWEHSFRGSPV